MNYLQLTGCLRFSYYIFRKLTDHLNGLREKLEKKVIQDEESDEANVGTENAVQFLLKMKPHQRTISAARSTELERKLNKLENLVGCNSSSTVRMYLRRPSTRARTTNIVNFKFSFYRFVYVI